MGRTLVWVGLALGVMGSCGGNSEDLSSKSGSPSGEAGSAGNATGGSDAGSAGDGGDGVVGGRDAMGGTGGADGGTGGAEAGTGGVAGESPCECSGNGDVFDPQVTCTLPLELFCLDDDPFDCAITLSDAFARVRGRCNRFMEEFGMRSDCQDGTTELHWFESTRDSEHRLVFDESGTLIGRYFSGGAHHDFDTNVCRVTDVYDFMEYQAGVVRILPCEPGCEICPGSANTCGQGGQAGQAGASGT
jgi:hypothetical protein